MHANVLCMNPHITTPLMGETWCNSRDVSTRQECQRPFWTAHDGHGRRCDTVLTSDASKHHCRNCGRVVCDECSKDGEGRKVGWRHMMTPCWSTPLSPTLQRVFVHECDYFGQKLTHKASRLVLKRNDFQLFFQFPCIQPKRLQKHSWPCGPINMW